MEVKRSEHICCSCNTNLVTMDMTCSPANLDYDNGVYMAIWMLHERTDALHRKTQRSAQT